jgi:hypothetical protein
VVFPPRRFDGAGGPGATSTALAAPVAAEGSVAAAGPAMAAAANSGQGAGPTTGSYAAAGPGPSGPGLAATRRDPGGAYGRPSAPPQPPVIVSRNGKEFTLTGATNIRAGTEIKVTTERPSVALQLSELDSGSWVIFELPGFAQAASGTPQDSLDALRKASVTSYYKDKDALWVKVVSNGEGARISGPGAGGTSVQVSR